MSFVLFALALSGEPVGGLSVTLDELVVDGPAATEGVGPAVQAVGDRLGACLRQRAPVLAQAVRVGLTVTAPGAVEPGSVRTGWDAQDPRGACVAGALGGVKLPGAAAPSRVSFLLRAMPTSSPGVRVSTKLGSSTPPQGEESEAVLGKSAVDAVVRRGLPAVRACYERELGRDPTLSGSVVVRFRVAPDGVVGFTDIESTTLNRVTVESCMVARFMSFRFPPSADVDGVVASYPFDFTSGASP